VSVEKKSGRQLDAEIAEFLTNDGAQSPVGRSWNSPDGLRRVVAEQGGRLFIETEGRRSHELLAPSELEAEIRRDEANAISRRGRETAKAAAEAAETARAVERTDDDGFTAAMSSVARQRALTVLDAKQRFDGNLRRRKDVIREFVAQGRQVVGSGKNRRLEAPDGRFYTEADITKTGMDYAAFLIARLR
jgi:uncharacterized protein (DUF4415 family)